MGRAHRHGMRVVLLVQLGWSRLLRASLAQLGVLVAHLDQSGVLEVGFAVVPGGVCWHLLAYERRVTRAASDVLYARRCLILLVVVIELVGYFDCPEHTVSSEDPMALEGMEEGKFRVLESGSTLAVTEMNTRKAEVRGACR